MDLFIVVGAVYLVAAPVALLFFYIWAVRGWRRREVVLLSLFSLPLTYAVGKLLGLFISNPLPFVVNGTTPLIEHAANNGFPSDHMLLAAAVSQIALHVNRRLGYVCWAFAICIGYARIAAGVHHIEDVVASASIAIVCVWLTDRILARFVRR